MFSRFLASFFILCSISVNVSSAQSDNPFAKNASLTIGTEISWKIDKEAVIATKTASDQKDSYYHLQFDNKQLKLMLSSDINGLNPKTFSQLEIKNVKIDGKQLPLFKWCLLNQQRHDRFLQQGLVVKKNICSIDGETGSFVMRLNKDTLQSLLQANRLSIMLKPFRTPLDLNYDISDFKEMTTALNARPEPEPVLAAIAEKTVEIPVAKQVIKLCQAQAPKKYKNIKSVDYNCDDVSAKNKAENEVIALVDQQRAKEKKLQAEKDRQRKLAEEKKQKALAEKLKQEQILQAEAVAIAASQLKQAQINDEITQKMLNVCKKFWDKDEHRCYCQKYIEHAPESIQASSRCE